MKFTLLDCFKKEDMIRLDLVRLEAPAATLPPTGLIKLDKEEAPIFLRHYNCQLNGQVRLEIDAINVKYSGRKYTGWLHQWDGKLVGFDPNNIADRILDKDLVIILEKLCPAILEEDRKWIENEPKEFIDTKGTRWIKG